MSLSIEPDNGSEPNFTFAFQPIVDTKAREVLSYEALIRGLDNQPAYQLLEKIPAERIHLFDEKVRPKRSVSPCGWASAATSI
jgi:EAL domain-containing protein (putative c-di-GMP-specific phosphodiesterase class I)